MLFKRKGIRHKQHQLFNDLELQNTRYPSLNGLRAISIVMVISHHLSLLEQIYTPLYEITWLMPLIELMQDGHMGVNVFFVISGFLITSLLIREEKQTNTVSLKDFYIRRTLRIFPAYYFMLLVYFVLQIAGWIDISAASWLTSLTYTKYFNWSLDWYTAHAWSLSIEEQFYLFWPVVFLGGQKTRKMMAITLFLAVPVIRVIVVHHPADWLNEMTLFLRIDAIATGCLFAIYQDHIIKRLQKHWRKLFYVVVILLIFLRYFPVFAEKIGVAFIFIPIGVTSGTVANVLIALLMMVSVFGPQTPWYRFLNCKPMNCLGLLSYSLYLWQQAFMNVSGQWFGHFPQNVFFIFAAAMLSYYLIEKPFLKLKRKFHRTER